MHDKFYLIHKIDNTKGMEREDGGFTEGMLFVMLYDQGDAPPPPSPFNSSPGYDQPRLCIINDRSKNWDKR